MSYVPIYQSVLTHRKTLKLARLLDLDKFSVLSRLIALWTWSTDNAGASSRLLPARVLSPLQISLINWWGDLPFLQATSCTGDTDGSCPRRNASSRRDKPPCYNDLCRSSVNWSVVEVFVATHMA
jgi:hypothetical protein